MVDGSAIGTLIIVFIIQIPLSILGIWKLIEVIVWIVENVEVVIG